MRLLELTQILEQVAMTQPCINMIVRDSVLNLNHDAANRYGAFVWTQGQHTASIESDVIRYRFTLFYVDRLVRGKDNITEVQSTGIDVLGNILRSLGEDYGLDIADWTLDTFTQRFTDDCAGAFATVEITAMQSTTCAEDFKGYLYTSEGWKVVDANGSYILVRI